MQGIIGRSRVAWAVEYTFERGEMRVELRTALRYVQATEPARFPRVLLLARTTMATRLPQFAEMATND